MSNMDFARTLWSLGELGVQADGTMAVAAAEVHRRIHHLSCGQTTRVGRGLSALANVHAKAVSETVTLASDADAARDLSSEVDAALEALAGRLQSQLPNAHATELAMVADSFSGSQPHSWSRQAASELSAGTFNHALAARSAAASKPSPRAPKRDALMPALLHEVSIRGSTMDTALKMQVCSV